MAHIILASGSPRRKMLLEWADITFEVIVSDVDESFPDVLPVEEVPVFIAKQKAHAVESLLKSEHRWTAAHCIVAADTIVVIENIIIGKPLSKEQAIEFISMLAGKTHQVITGVVVLFENKVHTISQTTKVTFNALTNDQIEYYVEKYKPYDKAGAYAIQEWIGVIGIASIEGDFYNVMGLPVNKLAVLLKDIKAM
jgi:septum formation protein